MPMIPVDSLREGQAFREGARLLHARRVQEAHGYVEVLTEHGLRRFRPGHKVFTPRAAA